MHAPRITSVLLALCLVGCLAPAHGDSLQAIPRNLVPDSPGASRLGEAEVLGIFELKSPDPRFGGLSGLSFDGHMVTAISDVGRWVRFRLDLDGDGRPQAVGGLEIGELGGLDGSKGDSDAEEIAWTPEGWVIGFERRHRLLLYPNNLAGIPVRLAPPQGYDRQPDNGGGEAVTRLSDGHLLVLSEDGGDDEATGWAWVGRPGAWQQLRYRRDGLFRPTGAATLPNGDVVVTERRFTLAGGVALRLVRLDAAAIRAGATLSGHELFRLEPPLLVDNYEGVTLHQRADGRMVALLISDDNFSSLQATYLMAVLLPD